MHTFYINILMFYVFYMFRPRPFIFSQTAVYTVMVRYKAVILNLGYEPGHLGVREKIE